jgi:hypothetical protein
MRVWRELACRPVLVQESEAGPTLLLDTAGKSFGLIVSGLEQNMLKHLSSWNETINLTYVLGAVDYHCTRLAETYCETATHFATSVARRLSITSNVTNLGGLGNEYYEFDALVTAIRRAYDALRHILWRFFGTKSPVPRSFPKTFPVCPKLPRALRQRCDESWTQVGIPVTHYRDCIQHYCPVDYGMSYVQMTRVADRLWTTHVPIPDNPRAKSRQKFTFGENLDALTFSWEAATEILGLSCDIVTVAHSVDTESS